MNFKRFCAKTSIESSSIQYENDDLMRVTHGDDYAIACCVSSMRVGKEMQFFGARANLAKCLLYAINGGVDEITKKQVGPKYRPITSEYLDYDEVMDGYKDMMKWLASVYVNALNIIHYMHDKYCYERSADGSPRQEGDPLVRHRHRRPVRGGRLPVRHQVRQGYAPSATKTALWWTTRSRATSPNTATTTTGWTTSPTTWCMTL